MFTLNLDKILSLEDKAGAAILGLCLLPSWLLVVIEVYVSQDPSLVRTTTSFTATKSLMNTLTFTSGERGTALWRSWFREPTGGKPSPSGP